MEPQNLRIPATKRPSFWNRNIFKGSVVGWLSLGVAGAAIGGLFGGAVGAWAGYQLGSTIGYFGGGIYGGIIGKKQLADELQYGKKVEKPGFWNQSIYTGLFFGSIVSGILVAIGATAAITPTIGAEATEAVIQEALRPYLNTIIGSYIGGTVLSGIIGGFVGKKKMEQEYTQALAIAEQQDVSPMLGMGMGRGMGYARQNAYALTPNDAALLESALGAKKNTARGNFTTQLEEARQRNLAQQGTQI